MDTSFVLVSGGVSGIGSAVVSLLAKRGQRPLAVDIHGESAAPGYPVWPYSVDVSDEAAVEFAVDQIEKSHGPIAGLVNAAGILGKMHAPESLRMQDWDREMAVDFRGTYLMCRAVGRVMAARGAGAIVNIASIAGMTSGPLHAYAPAKAAVIHLTTTLAAEWGPRGVRVNCVSPGFTRTPALEAGFAADVLDETNLGRLAALNRLTEPFEVAQAVAWLLGPDSSGVTGVNIPVDAGFLVGVPWEAYGGLRRSIN